MCFSFIVFASFEKRVGKRWRLCSIRILLERRKASMSAKLFEAALGLSSLGTCGRYLRRREKALTIAVDFVAGSRFAVPGIEGSHTAHDTVTKRYRHLNFFQHECHLEVRMPRVRLPDGSTRLVEPDWAGKLAGLTLLFEALIITLCREMTFAAVSRLVNLLRHRVTAICARYVDLALDQADFLCRCRRAQSHLRRRRAQ